MKKTIRAMMLGASALAFVTAPAATTQIFAQDTTAAAPAQTQCDSPDKTKLYAEDFQKNFKGNAQQQKVAYDAAKQYVDRFGTCNGEGDQAIITYLQKYIAKVDKLNADTAVEEGFLTAVKAKDTDKVFSFGKQLLAATPDNVAVILYMVDAGYSAAQKKVDNNNADTVNYAKQAIEKINGGKVTNNAYGPFKDKDESLAWMNYTVGYVTGNRQQQKNEAAPYLYKAVGFNSSLKSWYYPYLVVGEMYLDQYTKAAEEYNKIKDDTTLDEAKKNEAAGLWKAYADRAAEYYARAYTYAKADAKTKPEVTKGIYDTLTEVYKLRNNQQTTGIDTFITGFNSKPVTDPATAVTPVIEATPTTATATATTAIKTQASSSDAATTGGRATTSAGAGTGVGVASGTGAGRSTGTGTGVAATAGTATKPVAATKPATAKKPVAKKKS